MRVIDADLGEVRAVAVSPDGRLVAASGASGWLAVLDWADGAAVRRYPPGAACEQLAFGAGNALVYVQNETLRVDRADAAGPGPNLVGRCVAAAVSPDGKTLVATQAGGKERTELKRWALPARQPLVGFGFWSPFRRLAFSPDGQFLAGIWSEGFELRFAVSGGLDHRHRPPGGRPFDGPGFVAFERDSGTCVFGWESEFHVLDVSTGTSRPVHRFEAESRPAVLTITQRGRTVEQKVLDLGAPFRAAAFTGSGRHLATIEQPGRWKRWDALAGRYVTLLDRGANASGRLKLWDPGTWEVVREYDWGCGPLTCLAFSADGSAGVCGTADGRLVQFDVDE